MKRRARRRHEGSRAGRLGPFGLEGWNAGRLEGLFLLVLIGAPAPLLACPICFQVDEGPVTAGVRAAVLVLIGVTLGVLVGFGVFVARFVARSKAVRPGSEGAETAEKRPVPLCP